MNERRVHRVLVWAMALVALGSCGALSGGELSPDEARAVSPVDVGPTGVAPPLPGAQTPGRVAPAETPLRLPEHFEIIDADLNQVQALLLEARAEPLVVHLFASWCRPCEDEVGQLATLAAAMSPGVKVVGISMDLSLAPRSSETDEALRSFLTTRGVDYPVLLYTDSRRDELLSLMQVRDGLPICVVYGQQGALWARYLRPVRGDEVLDALEVNGVDVSPGRAALAAKRQMRAPPP